jgi:hypothetical protein
VNEELRRRAREEAARRPVATPEQREELARAIRRSSTAPRAEQAHESTQRGA